MSHCTDCGDIARHVDDDGEARCPACAGTVRTNDRLDSYDG